VNRTIDEATAADVLAIADLNVAAYREFAKRLGPPAWEAMQKNLRGVARLTGWARFLVVRTPRGLAGSVGYCAPGKSDAAVFEPEWASIVLLAVAPRHRRRGIARALLRECIRRARDDHAPAVGLFTSELMTGAAELYRSLGFREDRELPRRYGVRYWRLRLELPA
jgi:ribosomal protein S18 acetylase RimI-like enzyme